MKQKLLTTAFGLLMAVGGFAEILQFSNEERQVYADNYDEMKFRCLIAGQDAVTELRMKYLIPEEDMTFMYRLLTEREVRKATYDYTRTDPYERVRCKQRIDNLYQDSIDIRLIPYNNNVAGEIISIATRMAKTLGVSTENRAAIISLGLDVAGHLRKDPRYYYDIVVMDSLRSLMTKEQLTRMLRSKNAVRSVDKARGAWAAVKAAGLIEDEDSVECCKVAIEYYLQENVINDMFAGHDKVIRNNLSALWKRQPLIVRMREAMRKEETLKKQNEEKYESNDNSMAW